MQLAMEQVATEAGAELRDRFGAPQFSQLEFQPEEAA